MESTVTETGGTTTGDKDAVREVLEAARAEGREALSAPEAKRVADAYGLKVPGEGLATSADEAVSLADDMGYPVVLKIVSPDILHKTEAKGVLVGLDSSDDVSSGYDTIIENAKAYKADADITGVQVQQMLPEGQEVLIGAVTDPTFGPVMTFGIGGILVEVLRDVTFRLAPTSNDEALEMVNGIRAAEVLRGVRGRPGVDQQALADMIERVSVLVTDFPEISEVDLNPVLATEDGATAVDARFVLSTEDADGQPPRYSEEDILAVMERMFRPRAIAVVGASDSAGKIGNSVMKNLVDGGFEGEIYPVNPKADEIMGKKCFADVSDLPDGVDLAVFAIPAKFVPDTLAKVGDKGIAAAVLIPSGFAEAGEPELQEQLVQSAREHGVRFVGPNIYGVYYTPEKMSAAFTTPYDVQGSVALASQSGGIGMGILGFSRSTKMGVSSIVGLGNKADIDEDDLLTFFEDDENTQCVALHMEDLKDGRAFVEVAQRVSQKKPIVVLKAGATPAGTKAAASHTAALAGDDKVYEDILRQAGVVRAHSLQELLQFARCLPILPDTQGRERGDHHGRRRVRRAALRRVLQDRPHADGDAGRPQRRVHGVHPALRSGRQPGRHHRGRAAGDLSRHHRARSRGGADPLAGAGLLAHDHHPADEVRRGAGRCRRGVPRPRDREAHRGLAGRRRGGRGGVGLPVRPRHPGVSVHDRDPGGGLGRQVPLGKNGRPTGEQVRKE